MTSLGLLDSWIEREPELSAPALWQYEVDNFLGLEFPKEAAEKMNRVLNLNLKSVDLTGDMFHRCFEWIRQKGITFYDAAYLAVAAETGATLVTADKKLAGKLDRADPISLLNDHNRSESAD